MYVGAIATNIWSLWLSVFGYTLTGWQGMNQEILLEVVIERVLGCIWRPYPWEFGGYDLIS